MIPIDYIFMIGALCVASSLTFLIMYLIYRRGIALSISATIMWCMVVVSMIAFYLGREGITLARAAGAILGGTPFFVGAFIFLIRKIVMPAHAVVALANHIAEGGLEQHIDVTRTDEFGDMSRALQMMVGRLGNVIMQVKSASQLLVTASQRMKNDAGEMSQGINSQASAAEEASAAMEQMAVNIRQNASNARQTETIALDAAQNAQKSGDAIMEALQAIQNISGKVAVIHDISRQTRMLSLNATIEAARAQDQGKGFAIVASEVRSLAERSQDAAQEITELATSSVGVTESAGTTLSAFLPNIERTAKLVQEISAASREQETGANQVNQAIQQLECVTQQNTVVSESIMSAAENLTGLAQRLQEAINFFTGSSDIRGEHEENAVHSATGLPPR